MSEFQSCPNRDTNESNCTCPNSGCDKHGVCCLCVQNHLGKGNVPQCFVKAGIK